MADIKVKDLTDTQTINTDNEIMVLTNDEQNQVQNITVENLLTNILSSDNGNVLEQGTDGKLYVETPENITGELSDLTTTEKSSLVGAINEVDSDLTTEVTNRTNAVSGEATIRANADNNLQSQIDAITAASDVTDIVGTYAQLQDYDTTGLTNKSVIKVLQDESRENETTYYRWVITDGVGAWVLIGEEGPYTTIAYVDGNFVTKATVGDLNNLATSDKSSVVNAMNELASVLDPTQTADYIKNSKAIYSGEVSENALILPQIKEMAHSTFDRSKFDVVGSPNITDNGVASGFSQTGYLLGKNINIPANSKIEIILKLVDVIALATTEPQRSVFSIRNTDNTLLDVRFSPVGGSVSLVYANGATTRGTEGTGNLDLTGTYFMKFVFDNGTLKAYKGNTLDTLSQLGNTITDVYMNLALDTLYIGTSLDHTTFPFKGGSIALKYFQIIVNGVPYFSGNKTGIDTIKPDNFEAPSGGSLPTISADGIASGFSSTSYLTAPNVVIDTTKPFKCCLELTTGTVSGQGVVSFDSNWDVSFTSTKYFSWRPTSNQSNWMQTNETFEDNTKYYIEFGYDGTDIFINYKKQGGNLVTKSLTPANYVGATNLNISSIGCLSTLVFNGSIDLNSFKVYVDGDLVYQPCLKIPYTESKTGSKIVDSIYRDRVNDMAEQFGYANYYTLDEDNGNFTLPRVELYGYIEKHARDMAHPVGMPFFRLTDEINEDEVRLEGAEVDKGLYLAIEQKLASYCTASADPAKIILPNFIGKVPWGANDYGYISAGLPNITGYFVASDDTYSHIGGAFAIDSVGGAGTGGPGNEPIVSFNASRSSSIYSDSVSTVQPPAFKVRWLARWK